MPRPKPKAVRLYRPVKIHVKGLNCRKVDHFYCGARGEGRTPMVSPPADFESAASAIPPPGHRQVATPFLARALRRVKATGAPPASHGKRTRLRASAAGAGATVKSWLSGCP